MRYLSSYSWTKSSPIHNTKEATPTKRFKVGDHVRGAAGSQGYYTQPGELLEAVVTALSPDGDVRIRVIKHSKFGAETLPEFEVAISEIELIEEGG